jgi:hypothetical protein
MDFGRFRPPAKQSKRYCAVGLRYLYGRDCGRARGQAPASRSDEGKGLGPNFCGSCWFSLYLKVHPTPTLLPGYGDGQLSSAATQPRD